MPAYQLRHGDYRWEDKDLPITSLENLARVISLSPSELFDVTINDDQANLHNMILEYHGLLHDYQLKNRDVFDIVDIDYNVDSLDADVLKISYFFTVRFTGDRGHQQIKGKITLMDGN